MGARQHSALVIRASQPPQLVQTSCWFRCPFHAKQCVAQVKLTWRHQSAALTCSEDGGAAAACATPHSIRTVAHTHSTEPTMCKTTAAADLLGGPHQAVVQLQLVNQTLAQRRHGDVAALVFRPLHSQHSTIDAINACGWHGGPWMPTNVCSRRGRERCHQHLAAPTPTLLPQRTFLLNSEPASNRSSLMVRPSGDARPAQVEWQRRSSGSAN